MSFDSPLDQRTTTQERALAVETLEAVAALTLGHLKESWVKDPLLMIDAGRAQGEQGLKPVQVRMVVRIDDVPPHCHA